MIPAHLKKYFWEVDTKKLDPRKHPEYVIARILEYGDVEPVRWMLKIFDQKTIKKTLRQRRGFSVPTANFWKIYFNLNKNDILCLRKFYRKKLENLWPY